MMLLNGSTMSKTRAVVAAATARGRITTVATAAQSRLDTFQNERRHSTMYTRTGPCTQQLPRREPPRRQVLLSRSLTTSSPLPAAPLSATPLTDYFASVEYGNIKVSLPAPTVGLIELHRPAALNALSDALFADLMHALRVFDDADGVNPSNEVGCIVLTGSTKAFAAGADISQMKDKTFDYTYKTVSKQISFLLYLRGCF
jgi:Enoyl-CoA hydratase/isomerase